MTTISWTDPSLVGLLLVCSLVLLAALAAAAMRLARLRSKLAHLLLVTDEALAQRDSAKERDSDQQHKLRMLEAKLAEAEEQNRRLDRHNQALAQAGHDLQDERDNWRKMYHEALAGSSGMQSMLVNALFRCRTELQRAGAKIPTETGLDRVLEMVVGATMPHGTASTEGDQG